MGDELRRLAAEAERLRERINHHNYLYYVLDQPEVSDANNVLVGRRMFPCVRPTGIYDLKKILSQGKNVIAVYVPAGEYPGPAQILARGFFALAGSPLQEFRSDSTWKVSSTPDGIVDSYPWSSSSLDDTLWAGALEADSGERFSTLQPVSVDPRLLETRPTAKWIAAREGGAKQVSFAYNVNLPFVRGETWLQVAATGAYDVTINGRPAAVWTVQAQAQLVGPQAPVLVSPQTVLIDAEMPVVVRPNSGVPGAQTPAATLRDAHVRQPRKPATMSPRSIISPYAKPEPGVEAEMPGSLGTPPRLGQPTPQLTQLSPSLGESGGVPILVAHDISHWMSAGKNEILIRVRSDYGPPLLLAEGYTYVDGRPSGSFGTDETWRDLLDSRSAKPAVPENAIVVASYGDQPWGTLPQAPSYPQSLPGADVRILLEWMGVIVAAVAVVWVGWFAASAMCAAVTGTAPDQIWFRDALLHLPLLAALLLLWLLSYDVRLPNDWCFTPGVTVTALAYIFVSKLFLFNRSIGGSSEEAVSQPSDRPRLSRYWMVAALAGIMLAGMAVRLAGLLDASFGHDEAKMADFSLGILKTGYPHSPLGSFTKWLCTYELIPYPLALSSLIFGKTVFAYRLPALIFGSLTIGLIGWTGYRLMDWRVGLVSALIYAFLPAPINWSRDGFYLSQESFFALLTFWLFFETLRTHPLRPRYLTLTALAVLLTYFSWEGSGFILPTFVITILVLRWGEYDWMVDWNLWRVFLVMVAAILLQLANRNVLLIPDYLAIAYDVSEVTTPTLVFLNRLIFNPLFYVDGLFLTENHVLLSVLALAAFVAFRKNKAILYLGTVLFTLELCYTLLLPAYAPRYAFQATTLLVLTGVGGFFCFWDRVFQAGDRELPRLARAIRACSLSALLALFVLAGNPFVAKLYRLAADPTDPPYFGRIGVQFKPDYRSADLYVAQHMKPGDAVITRQPHVFAYYTKRSADYAWDTLLNFRTFYDGGQGTPHYIDRWDGVPVMRTLQELMDLRASHSRLWLIIASKSVERELDFDDTLFIRTRGQVVFETNLEEVVLFSGTPNHRTQEAN